MLIDVHTHVTPASFPGSPSEAAASRWPCMRCTAPTSATVMIGDKPFRELDDRSWDAERRIADMDRDGVAIQVLSPMPELLSYWMAPDHAGLVCDTCNGQIAGMIARHPTRFRGLGAVRMQLPELAAADARRLRREFGLSGIEIGSNINGIMLGDPSFDAFWAAAEDEGLAIFIHALHPVAAAPSAATPVFSAFALFPIDVAMAAASLAMGGVIDRFPGLRIGFSHGGGAMGAILGRLDTGWIKTEGFRGRAPRRPSEQARAFFYDSNVYDPAYLRHLAMEVAAGQVFVGTDYPYDIMQKDPAAFVASAGLSDAARSAIHHEAAESFLGERFTAADAKKH